MKIAKIVTALLAIILLINFPIILVRAQTHNADAMWVEPSLTVYNSTTGHVGTLFNVTVWLNMTENIYAYQIGLHYNRTQLMCTRSDFTGSGGKSNYFAGHTTTPAGPLIDTSSLGNGSVEAGETVSGSDKITGPKNASLIWIEFQILIVPSAGNFTSTFDLTTETLNGNNFVLDSDLNTLSITAYNSNYLFVGPQGGGLPLSVSINANSTSIALGQSVLFTSTVTGGSSPYTAYQWFLNLTAVPSATSSSWIYTPTENGSALVYLNVTDSKPTVAQSNSIIVTVSSIPPPIGGTRIYVDPSEIKDLTMGPSNIFYVNITLANVTNLRLCTFNLAYDPSVINWISIELFRVQGEYPIGTIVLNGTPGILWTSLNYPTPISTDLPAPIVRIGFHVEAYGISPLHLTDTQLLDAGGQPIVHDASDGFFSNIIRDVAVTNVVPSTNWVYQGSLDEINVTVKNLGNVSETFTVSAYYNSSLIGTVPIVNLASNAETTTSIMWNTTGVLEGNYTITGIASTVPYETNTANNIYVDGIVQVVTVIHDVAITNVTPAGNWTYQGRTIVINVTAVNLGNVSESFNVTAYADNDTIGVFPISNLASNGTVTISFVWNTTFAELCHNYTISGQASIVPYEYNTTNNVLVDGTVTIRLMGDVNGDGRVDIRDIAIVAKAFAAIGPDYLYPGSPPSPNWNPDADLNADNRIDVRDISIVAKHFGQTCP